MFGATSDTYVQSPQGTPHAELNCNTAVRHTYFRACATHFFVLTCSETVSLYMLVVFNLTPLINVLPL